MTGHPPFSELHKRMTPERQARSAESAVRMSARMARRKIPVRSDMDADTLRKLAQHEKDRHVRKRILAIVLSMEGAGRAEVCATVRITRGALKNWIKRFNAGGVDGLRDKPRRGSPFKLSPDHMSAFVELVRQGPTVRTGVPEWNARFLCGEVERRFGVTYGVEGMRRLLRSLGFTWQNDRYRLSEPRKVARPSPGR